MRPAIALFCIPRIISQIFFILNLGNAQNTNRRRRPRARGRRMLMSLHPLTIRRTRNINEKNMRPSPSLTSTPTYSADRAKLPPNTRVSSIEEAREAASSWDICSSRALDKRGGIESILSSTSLKSADGSYDLERILKKCYEVAFYMPPSPSAMQRSPSVPKPSVGSAPPPLTI